jgi:cation:H+ antiporter
MAEVATLVFGIVAVILGAELFFHGLLGISARLGAAPFVVTVIISGFEIENLVVGIAANAKGLPGAAAGTFLGGATFISLGVTGLAAIVRPLDAGLPWKPLAATAASPLGVVVLGIDGTISRSDGAILVMWFLAVTVAVTVTGRYIVTQTQEDEETRSRPFTRLLGGLTILSLGGDIVGDSIRNLVSRSGISQTLLGNTILAASVEAEEVARVALPAKRGRSDVAVGNIIGTIIHFVAFNAGVIALIDPLKLDTVTRHLHLPVAVGSVGLVALVLATRKRISRLEGAAMLILYSAYVGFAIAAET